MPERRRNHACAARIHQRTLRHRGDGQGTPAQAAWKTRPAAGADPGRGDGVERQLPARHHRKYLPRRMRGGYRSVGSPTHRRAWRCCSTACSPPAPGLVLADGEIDTPPAVAGFGRSLLHALRGLLERHYAAVCLLNSDSPTLPTADAGTGGAGARRAGRSGRVGTGGGWRLLHRRDEGRARRTVLRHRLEHRHGRGANPRARRVARPGAGSNWRPGTTWTTMLPCNGCCGTCPARSHPATRCHSPHPPPRPASSAWDWPTGWAKPLDEACGAEAARAWADWRGPDRSDRRRLAYPSAGALDGGSRTRKAIFVVLGVAATLLYFAACWLVLRGPAARRGVWLVLGVAVAMRLVVLAEPAFLSTDLFRYVWGWPRATRRHRPLPLYPGRPGPRSAARYDDLSLRQPP